MVEKELEKELEMYLSLYEDEYTEDEINFIRSNLINFFKSGTQIDITSQVLVALGRLPDCDNRYKKYLEFLKTRYSLDGNILEVACGKFPALSKYIDEYQKDLSNGSITAYDPKLITTSYGNIRLHKKIFDDTIDLSNYSLVTAIHPSEATVQIIEAANKGDRDFSILTCGCAHFPDKERPFFYTPAIMYEWQNYLINVARRDLSPSRTLDIDYIDGINTPVISSRKKVKMIQK